MKSEAVRRWNIPAAILLLLALSVSAERLVATEWTPGLWITITLVLRATILGFTLGMSRFRRTGIILLSFGYSLILLPWALGRSQYPDIPWLERLANLGSRLTESIVVFLSREPVKDPLLFLSMAAAVYWILGLHAGYALARKANFIVSILPAGIVLFLIQLYDNWSSDRIVFLAFYIFIGLLLLGQLIYSNKQNSREEKRVWISSAAKQDMNISMAVTALMTVLIAWLAPSPSQAVATAKGLWNIFTQPLKETREDLGNIVAGLEHTTDLPTADFYGDTLHLGQIGASGDTVMFNILVPKTLPDSRYYWMVRTYDEYSNNAWRNTSTSERSLLPFRSMPLTPDATQWPAAEFTFTVMDRIYFLATPKQPVWISLPATLTYLPVSNKILDPQLISVDPAIQTGETYIVYAAIASPNVVQLRAAGSDYPSWVTSRYLQLPEDFPQEIAALAQQVSVNANTPFDKASAITNYLRTEIRYNRSILPTPIGQDPLVWFLFSSKEGFCNYYASAEVLMLRSIGIPARMVVGFSNGERQVPYKRIVRQKDAHAWPEVYFPDLGWVEFEPTVSEQPIIRPIGDTNSLTGDDRSLDNPTPLKEDGGNPVMGDSRLPEDEMDFEPGTEQNRFERVSINLLIILASTIGIAMLILASVGKKKRRQIYANLRAPTPVLLADTMELMSLPIPAWLQRWVNWSKLGSVERSFRTIHRSLHWLGVQSNPAHTPAESAALLINRLPDAAINIEALLHEYQQTLFGPHPGSPAIAREAAKSIQRISLRAAIQRQMKTMQKFGRRQVSLRETTVQPKGKNN